MTVPYTKQSIPVAQQLQHLESRGLVIKDRVWAAQELSCIGYYRLKAYVHPFRITPDKSDLRPGTTIESVIYCYDLDRELRLAVFQALERIEVGIRAVFIQRFTSSHGPFGHRNPRAFVVRKRRPNMPVLDHPDFISKLDKEVGRSKEKFVTHFARNYDGAHEIPCWMALQLVSFGTLAKLYYSATRAVRESVATDVGLHEPVLGSWMHTLSYVRNICAHHHRLWNRVLALRPALPDDEPEWVAASALPSRMFLLLLMVRRLLRGLNEDGSWAGMMEKAFDQRFSHPWTARGMGFPFQLDAGGVEVLKKWTLHPLWK